MATPDIREQLIQAAEERHRPDGTPYKSLSSQAVRQLAETSGENSRQVERAALAAGIVPERYTRNMTTLKLEDQLRLLDSTVCVVGAGGLGGSVTEILARVGVGNLRLVDGDHFEDSNLNRQRFANLASLDQPKATIAGEHLAAINPAVTVTAITERLTMANGPDLIANAQIAIDCLDSLQARIALQAACRQKHIPMVTAAVAGVSGQLSVIYPQDQGLSALYGDLDSAVDRGAETTLGNLAFAVNLLASLECTEAIKVLLGRSSTLRGRLLVFDLTDLTFDIIRLDR